MKKILVLLFSLLLFTGCATHKSPVEQTTFLIDTIVTISIYSYDNKQETQQLIQDTFSLCKDYENMFSRTIQNSDIDKINHSNGNTVRVSPETIELLNKSIELGKLSSGSFDVTINPISSLWDFKSENAIPPEKLLIDNLLTSVNYNNIKIENNTVTLLDKSTSIDLGGIAKGYIADKAAEFLKQKGVTSAIINLGGNIMTIGGKPDGTNFNIGVQKPFETQNQILGAVSVKDKSIVTSGIYQRFFKYNEKLYHHILNPETGFPTENNLLSVTIISNTSVEGDGLSTTCFILGMDKGMDLIESLNDVEAIFVTKDDEVFYSSGIGNNIEFKLQQ